MKKLTVFMLISVLLVGAVYGQGIRNDQRANDTQRRNERQRNNDPVTVEGTLKLERGFVAVESGDSVYYVPMLNRYIGFINDLKEGTRISVEGREFRNTIRPTKVTIGGKSYDFPTNNRAPGFENRSTERSRDNFAPNRDNFGKSRRNGPGRGSCCR